MSVTVFTKSSPTGKSAVSIAALLSLILAISLVSLLGVPAAAAPGDIAACSTDAAGNFGNANSGMWFLFPTASSVSADGRYVAFQSAATDILGASTPTRAHIYRKGVLTGAIERCSLGLASAKSDGDS